MQIKEVPSKASSEILFGQKKREAKAADKEEAMSVAESKITKHGVSIQVKCEHCDYKASKKDVKKHTERKHKGD